MSHSFYLSVYHYCFKFTMMRIFRSLKNIVNCIWNTYTVQLHMYYFMHIKKFIYDLMRRNVFEY